jgi:predicted O-linked N-acetylglucosamine transferase (SPINDLY family)
MMITVPEGRTRERIREAFAKEGVGAERLDLRGRLAHADFLQAHADATVHTLWMGVPLVTLAGTTHLSRVGVSMLANVGLSDLVATTEEEYVRVASELAPDVPRLQALRAGLREAMERGPVMDGPRFARSLEQLYASIAHE